MDVRTIPCPPATARVGWTVYARDGAILGWVRRAADADASYDRPPGTFWAIPRVGAGDSRAYATPGDAARAMRKETAR